MIQDLLYGISQSRKDIINQNEAIYQSNITMCMYKYNQYLSQCYSSSFKTTEWGLRCLIAWFFSMITTNIKINGETFVTSNIFLRINIGTS